MQKPQLINFIAKVMEDSGFRVYKNFKTSQTTVDIYAVLPTQMGDFSVVVTCKNYDKEWEVGIDILKEMEMVGKSLKVSKVAVVTSSTFSPQARNYASRKNIKLVDRDNLISLAKKYAEKNNINSSLNNNQNNNYNNDNNQEEYGSDLSYDEESDLGYNSYYEPYDDSLYNESESDNDLYYREYNGYDDYTEPYDDSYYENLAISNYNPDNHVKNASYSYSNNNNYGRANLYKSEIPKNEKKSRFSLNRKSERTNSVSDVPKVNKENKNNSSFARLAKSGTNKIYEKSSSFNFNKFLSNPIVLIIVVVLVSYLIAYALNFIGGFSSGMIGLVEMIFSLILSYGLVSYVDKDGTTVLIKGTSVFFISLVVLIVLIIFI